MIKNASILCIISVCCHLTINAGNTGTKELQNENLITHTTDGGNVVSAIYGKVMFFIKEVDMPELVASKNSKLLLKAINIDTFPDWQFPSPCLRLISPDTQSFLYEVHDNKTSKRLIFFSNKLGGATILGIPSKKSDTELDLSQTKWKADTHLNIAYVLCKAKNNADGFLARVNLRAENHKDICAEFTPFVLDNIFSNNEALSTVLENCEQEFFWQWQGTPPEDGLRLTFADHPNESDSADNDWVKL